MASEKKPWRVKGYFEYKGKLYMPYEPPQVIEAASNFPAQGGDVLFGTYLTSG
jgi:hypothetical protein